MPGTPEDEQIAAQVGEIVYGIPNLEEALLDLLDAIGKGFALCEIIWEVAGGQARVSELRWIPQKKVTFGEDLEAPAADSRSQLARGDAPGLEGDLPPLQGQKRPRHPGRGAAGGGLDVPAEEFCLEGLGGVQRGLRHAAAGWGNMTTRPPRRTGRPWSRPSATWVPTPRG